MSPVREQFFENFTNAIHLAIVIAAAVFLTIYLIGRIREKGSNQK